MRGYSVMSDEDRQSILKQHSTPYDGYATGNVQSNMTPLSVYDPAGDKFGVTVDNKGNVKQYTNHNVNEGVNEITAKPGNYDEIEPAYEFESDGPQQSMTQLGVGKRPYDFVSQGPSDVYEDEVEEEMYEDAEFDDLLNADEDLQIQRDQIEESVNKSLDMFKRFQKYN
jgi:hypothetical protein